MARTGVGDPNAGQTENLDAITAVVLGGTSLFGGRGVVLGSLIGVLIVGVFRNGLTLMGVSSIYQVLVTGVLVILAVATDQFARRGGRAIVRLRQQNSGLRLPCPNGPSRFRSFTSAWLICPRMNSSGRMIPPSSPK